MTNLVVNPAQRNDRRRDKFTKIRGDTQIQAAVEDLLTYDPRVRGGDISVTSRNAAVTLNGGVATLKAKQAATENALNTLGVRRVFNNLKVRVGQWPGDMELTRQAEQAIARDAYLVDFALRPSSHFGKMYISGEVNTYFEKSRVDAVVANIPGVLQVINRVQVDSVPSGKSDEEILEDAVRRLQWSPFLEPDDIDITVDDGVVSLIGIVDTWQDRKAATRHAEQAGAERVKNQLQVRIAREESSGLKTRLVPLQNEYQLPSEQQGESFRQKLVQQIPVRDPSRLPAPQKVDLVLQLENENENPFLIRVGHDKCEIKLSLTGPGAVRIPVARSFTADFRRGRIVTIPPGEVLKIPIGRLQYGFRNASSRWYWTETGRYLLQATYSWPLDRSGLRMAETSAPPVELIVKPEWD